MTNQNQGTDPCPLKDRAVGMTIYLLPGDHRRLRMLAAAEDSTLQGLVMDALDMLMGCRGQTPVERWTQRRKHRQSASA